jgi:hypothetical protein
MKIEQNKSQQRAEATLTNDEVTQHVERVKQGDETSVSVLMEFLFPFVAKILNARLRYRESKEDVS